MMNSVAKPASSWSTKILQFEGSFFFVRSEKKDGNYTVDVVMKGSQEDCEHFMVEASLLNVESGKSVFKASFQPRPLTNQNEFIYSLSVPESGKTVFKSLFQPSSFVTLLLPCCCCCTPSSRSLFFVQFSPSVQNCGKAGYECPHHHLPLQVPDWVARLPGC